MLATFNWDDMPQDTHYGLDPSAIIRLQRGMSAREFDEDSDFPIKSRAFRLGRTASIQRIIELINNGDGIGLMQMTHQQTMEGMAAANDLATPFISLAPANTHADWHAKKHTDGILVDITLPASSLIVPWMMENTPGRTPYEVHAVGAIPAANIVNVTPI